MAHQFKQYVKALPEDDLKSVWQKILKTCNKMKWEQVFNPVKKDKFYARKKYEVKNLFINYYDM